MFIREKFRENDLMKNYLFQFRLSLNDCVRKLVVLAIVNISKCWAPSIKTWANSKTVLAQISTTRVQIFWFGWQLPSNIDMWIHEVSHLYLSMPLKIYKRKNINNFGFFLSFRLI